VEAFLAKNIFTKTESARIIDTLFELIKQSLQNGWFRQLDLAR
jgi:nucleoid DNA-binding protein